MIMSFPPAGFIRTLGFCAGLALIFGSCVNTRKITYMQGSFDTAALSKIVLEEPVIKKGDILSIIVYSDNPAATAIFNQPVNGGGGTGGSAIVGMSSGAAAGATSLSSSSPSGGSPGAGGYLVDEKGNIQMQQIGVIHVDSLSRSQLKDTLEAHLKEFLSNPYVTIRFLNYRFTMLGEVNHPGIFNMPGEQVNLFEALGLGGDLTFYGRRDNILVVRETNGKREYGRMDLTKPEVVLSPYFNLKPNDVVYVEANRKKIAASDQSVLRNVTIVTSVVSVLALMVTIFRR